MKVPVWFDANDPRRGDELIRFVELLGASNIDVVGIIDRPPAGSELANRLGRDAPIAEVLSPDSSTWSPALEPVMTRLSLRVRWWQLGRDNDTSFAGYPGTQQAHRRAAHALFRFGQDVRMGMSWDWASADDDTGHVTWDFQQLRCETPPTEKEFDELLGQAANQLGRALGTSIEPPPPIADAERCRPADALAARSSEFVRRLVAAKVAGAIASSSPIHSTTKMA